jgi:hypothetical protein
MVLTLIQVGFSSGKSCLQFKESKLARAINQRGLLDRYRPVI